MASLRSPLVLILVVLFGAGAPLEVWARQQRNAPRLSQPVLTADASKLCCRVCRKGKPCGDGCISATKQCKKGKGCACAASGGSLRWTIPNQLLVEHVTVPTQMHELWVSPMFHPMRMVSKHRWRLDDLGDPERTSRLLNPSSSLALLNVLMADATQAAQDGQIRPDWDPCISRPGFGRVQATIPLSRALFDQLFNGRSGYRAQYCLSVKEGRQYNRAIVDALIPAIRSAHANQRDRRLRWCDVERSLTGSYSKIWMADDEEHFQIAPAALHVPGWTGWGLRVPLPSSPKLDVKGTFIRLGSRDEFTTKLYRDHDLHRVGSPG